MLFHIRHRLDYSYDHPVFLEPMTLRLTPRQDASQRLLRHSLRIVEPPLGQASIVEPDGSDAVVLWFGEKRQSLVIEVESVVETLRDNPFAWIVTDAGAQHLPAHYQPGEAASLAPSCGGAVAEPVRSWAAELAAGAQHHTLDFLTQLTDTIHLTFHHVGRPDGEPLPASDCLTSRCGACRDTAMLFVEACRSQGLAARFVSGYSMHHPPEVSEQELHAWAEVYLPGGGWRAYDPSLGLAVADGHVAIAAAPDHQLAAPVSGTYRGTGIGSNMGYTVRLRAAATAAELNLPPADAFPGSGASLGEGAAIR
ncbi:MAG: transglutaminase family protein [Cyanobium sp.]|nr:transglutaminase family protein [Synechococcus sp. CS-1333]PZV22604.1 MAG: transglutaminase family protein [Cyanobium sp.]